jgi:pimeloyl-ACP methyl ester carboxylesterase
MRTSDSQTSDSVVDLDGIPIAVRRIEPARSLRDDSPTLVFLHDSLGCIETWRDFPPALAERVSLRVMVYDRQGYGRSAPFGSEPRTSDYLAHESRALFALLDELEIDTAILFGHSDGGSIALIAAGERPERIAGVITEGAHVFVEEETLAGIRDARRSFETTDLARRLARYHGDKVPAIASAWIDTWLSPAFRDWNIESYLPSARCPALIIQGERDEYGTAAQVDAIVRGFGGSARALMIPGIGHTPHREAREIVLDASAELIRNIWSE